MLLIFILIILFASPYLFGSTFDIWDLVFIIGGVALGVTIDYIWREEEKKANDED